MLSHDMISICVICENKQWLKYLQAMQVFQELQVI